MDLVTFFDRLSKILLKTDMDKGFNKTLAMFANNLMMQVKFGQLAPYGRHYWRTIVQETRGMEFWKEFKGDEELKKNLKEFLSS